MEEKMIDKLDVEFGSDALEGELVSRPVGRPTKYEGDRTVEVAYAYVGGKFRERGEVIPSYAGLASFLGVAKKTVINWGEQHPEFLLPLERLHTEQERILVSEGLAGNFSQVITRLVLSNHGYSEKQQVEHSGKDGAAGGFVIGWGNSNASS